MLEKHIKAQRREGKKKNDITTGNASAHTLGEKCLSYIREAMNAELPYKAKMKRHAMLYAGKHWESDGQLEMMDDGESKPVINLDYMMIESMVPTIVAYLPEITVVPKKKVVIPDSIKQLIEEQQAQQEEDGNQPIDEDAMLDIAAQIATKTIRHLFEDENMDNMIREIAYDIVVYSRGGFAPRWEKEARGGRGWFRIDTIDPIMTLIDPRAKRELHDARYFIEINVYDKDEAEFLFPQANGEFTNYDELPEELRSWNEALEPAAAYDAYNSQHGTYSSGSSSRSVTASRHGIASGDSYDREQVVIYTIWHKDYSTDSAKVPTESARGQLAYAAAVLKKILSGDNVNYDSETMEPREFLAVLEPYAIEMLNANETVPTALDTLINSLRKEYDEAKYTEVLKTLKYPEGRCTIITGNSIIDDMPSPYAIDGGFPFLLIGDYRVPRTSVYFGELDNIDALNKLLNNTMKAILDNLEFTGNNQLFINRKMVSDVDSISNVAGAINFIEGNPKDAILFHKGDEANYQYIQLLNIFTQFANDISGLDEFIRGKYGKEASGLAIRALQVASEKRVLPKAKKISEAISKLAEQIIRLAGKYMLDDYVFRTTPRAGSIAQNISLTPEMLAFIADNFKFTVQEKTDIDISDSAILELMKSVLQYQPGVIELDDILDMLDMPGKEKYIQRIRQNRINKAKQQLASVQAQQQALQGVDDNQIA